MQPGKGQEGEDQRRHPLGARDERRRVIVASWRITFCIGPLTLRGRSRSTNPGWIVSQCNGVRRNGGGHR